MQHVNDMHFTYQWGGFSSRRLMLCDLTISLMYDDLIVNGVGFWEGRKGEGKLMWL